VEQRGDATVDLVRESDGATIDELDVSGPATEIWSADRRMATFSLEGRSIYAALDALEVELFAAQGLPPLFYFDEGNFTERVWFPADPAATTVEAAEVLNDTALGVRDVCDMLDGEADDD
jgi:hypothetical protein